MTDRDILPISPDVLETDDEERSDDALRGDFIFEPEPEEILARLLPVYLETQIYRALLESAASFQGAQMTAMRNASKNAGELIDRVTLQMNRARQAEITQEILEVVAGAERSPNWAPATFDRAGKGGGERGGGRLDVCKIRTLRAPCSSVTLSRVEHTSHRALSSSFIRWLPWLAGTVLVAGVGVGSISVFGLWNTAKPLPASGPSTRSSDRWSRRRRRSRPKRGAWRAGSSSRRLPGATSRSPTSSSAPS